MSADALVPLTLIPLATLSQKLLLLFLRNFSLVLVCETS